MRIVRHIAPIENETMWSALASVGVSPNPIKGYFEIAEDDVRWPEVLAVCEKVGLRTNQSMTQFAEEERQVAEYLVVAPTWHNGYPQPEDKDPELVYDTRDMCSRCSVGWIQVAPYRLKKEPNWGNRSFFQLNWVFGDYFVKQDVYERVFKPAGVDCWPVLLHRKDTVIAGVVQLRAVESVHVDIVGIPTELCDKCGRLKYNRPRRGFQPMPYGATGAVVSSLEWFGSGGSADHMLMVSQAIYRQIKDLKGIAFFPCGKRPYELGDGGRI